MPEIRIVPVQVLKLLPLYSCTTQEAIVELISPIFQLLCLYTHVHCCCRFFTEVISVNTLWFSPFSFSRQITWLFYCLRRGRSGSILFQLAVYWTPCDFWIL